MSHYTHFSQEERCVLAAFLREGLSLRAIARRLNRSVGGISMEIRRSSLDGSRECYDPYSAHFSSRMKKWDANRRNPLKDTDLHSYVLTQLKEGWSPVVIAGVLRQKHGVSIISHEAIYQWAYKEGLSSSLPRGKPRRHRKRYRLKKAQGTQGLGPVIGIEKRPKTVATRRRFGDWEGDSMLGRRKRGVILSVQQERKSRYVLLSLCKNKSAPETTKAVQKQLEAFPVPLCRSLTLDRGTENAEWQDFGLPVYFCDPYSSWQKGSVEHVIGLIRRYLPKGMDLSTVTAEDLRSIQDKLNHRPRQILGFRSPHDVFSSHCKRLGVQLPS